MKVAQHLFRILVISAVAAVSVEGQRASSSSPELTAQLTSLEQRLSKELLDQRAVWQADEVKNHGRKYATPYTEVGLQRLAMMHCHRDGDAAMYTTELVRSRDGRSESSQLVRVPYPMPSMISRRRGTLIAHSNAFYSICPNWIPVATNRSSKEHEYSGRSLEPVVARPFSAELVQELAAAAQRFPANAWLIGQLTRVLVENNDLARVQEALDRCQASVAWCEALKGYAEFAAGRLASADRHFTRALAENGERCVWMTIEMLLPRQERERYQGLGCDARAALDRAMWWLANPLFSEPANRRLLEHYSRRVRNQLVAAVPLDPFYNFASPYIADAAGEMRTRYGWATHMFWFGPGSEQGHWQYLGRVENDRPPYPVPEYSRNSQSTFAPLAYATSPLRIADSAYQLRFAGKATAEKWWPSEFFRHPDGVIAEMRSQRAIFRRDSSALLVMATAVTGGALDSIGSAPFRTYLMASLSPDQVQFMDSANTTAGSTVVLTASITKPAIIAMEHRIHANGVAGARTRFGVESIPTLENLPGRCALSDPVLFDAAFATDNGIDDLERGMLGSTALHKRSQVGVAWETYGVASGDTATVSVSVANVTELSRLRRAGLALGIARDSRFAVSVRWTEFGSRRPAVRVNSTVPVLQHQLTVDISKLTAGDYLLEITSESASCGLVTSQASVSITR